mmetsp:Transcript_6232/g.15486  ORF Transcript_6232/g.15486 Transcript_6232/m.15486 type:complete len:411 (+) Transcript_6232:41-1273(+)
MYPICRNSKLRMLLFVVVQNCCTLLLLVYFDHFVVVVIVIEYHFFVVVAVFFDGRLSLSLAISVRKGLVVVIVGLLSVIVHPVVVIVRRTLLERTKVDRVVALVVARLQITAVHAGTATATARSIIATTGGSFSLLEFVGIGVVLDSFLLEFFGVLFGHVLRNLGPFHGSLANRHRETLVGLGLQGRWFCDEPTGHGSDALQYGSAVLCFVFVPVGVFLVFEGCFLGQIHVSVEAGETATGRGIDVLNVKGFLSNVQRERPITPFDQFGVAFPKQASVRPVAHQSSILVPHVPPTNHVVHVAFVLFLLLLFVILGFVKGGRLDGHHIGQFCHVQGDSFLGTIRIQNGGVLCSVHPGGASLLGAVSFQIVAAAILLLSGRRGRRPYDRARIVKDGVVVIVIRTVVKETSGR